MRTSKSGSFVPDNCLRRRSGAGVLQGSLPVVSFGNPGAAAVVATVSLNPNSKEFLTRARGDSRTAGAISPRCTRSE